MPPFYYVTCIILYSLCLYAFSRYAIAYTACPSAGYDINSHFSLKLQVNDLLNRAVIFKQEVPSTGEEVEVERYKKGANLEIGFSYKL